MTMWKIVRKVDLLDEVPYWYVDADDERAARIDLARALKCKAEDLRVVAKQPDHTPSKKGKRS